ncbi:hypothetical protein [Krasilnikovia sp. MM14-A1259]|uniref:hypothetical protein n=1 Tax=Krasilnikovia sp. MM14-A1259 TaxID=3373539 RepID=UPI00399D0514
MALAGLAGILTVATLPSPASAKSSYDLTIRERQVSVGQDIHVTVTLGDDAGLGTSRMCLFQMVGDRMPPLVDGEYQTRVTDKYHKVADCLKPTFDDPDVADTGSSKFVLRATTPGRLTLVAIRDNNGLQTSDEGHPKTYIGTQPVTITVRGQDKSADPNAKISLVRIEQPPPPPPSPSQDPSAYPTEDDDITIPDSGDEPSPAPRPAAAESTDQSGWTLIGATLGGMLVGGVLTGVLVARRTRRRPAAD